MAASADTDYFFFENREALSYIYEWGAVPCELEEGEPVGDPDVSCESEPLEGAIRFLEGAGARGTVELLAAELLAELRDGTPAEAVRSDRDL